VRVFWYNIGINSDITMNFKIYNRSQNILLPSNYSTFLGESHEAVVLAELLDELDLSSLEESYSNESGGRSAYHPVMLLSVLVYGYMNGIFSSRKIAGKLKQDLAFMYLAGNNTPNFRTLARFRKEKGFYLETILADVVNKTHMLGFISFGTTSLDGTKIKANASKGKNETQDSLEKKIKGFLEEAERIDALEDEAFGDNEDDVDPELKTKAGRDKKKQELEKKREQTEVHLQARNISLINTSQNTKINTTDADSKLMKMKQGNFANGYNIQTITENGFVLSSFITNTGADQNLLIPTLQAFQRIHKTMPRYLLADKGYSSEDNFVYCEQEGINAYIPIHKDPIDLTQYLYDSKNNTYTDTIGCVFRFKQHVGSKGQRKKGRPKKTEEVKFFKRTKYQYIDEKTKEKKYLSVSLEWQRLANEHKQKLATPKGKERYKKRMPDVEGVFGNIKHNLKFTTFLLRGLTGVAIEWNLISLAHNLKKII